MFKFGRNIYNIQQHFDQNENFIFQQKILRSMSCKILTKFYRDNKDVLDKEPNLLPDILSSHAVVENSERKLIRIHC